MFAAIETCHWSELNNELSIIRSIALLLFDKLTLDQSPSLCKYHPEQMQFASLINCVFVSSPFRPQNKTPNIRIKGGNLLLNLMKYKPFNELISLPWFPQNRRYHSKFEENMYDWIDLRIPWGVTIVDSRRDGLTQIQNHPRMKHAPNGLCDGRVH